MDRLTTLVEKFHLTVRGVPLDQANLVALSGQGGVASKVLYFSRKNGATSVTQPVLFAAQVDWAGPLNPLLAALPDVVDFDLANHANTALIVQLMQQETQAKRCGAQSVINRLGEALMVRLLRDQIERGATQVGLLAGLADPRLSRAIVSIHDFPGRLWNNRDLAQIAGLSLSRFAELFGQTVGETPMSYLRRWRLTLAHQDVARGARIDAVARRYAYGSPESFSRAFRRAYGISPTALRRS